MLFCSSFDIVEIEMHLSVIARKALCNKVFFLEVLFTISLSVSIKRFYFLGMDSLILKADGQRNIKGGKKGGAEGGRKGGGEKERASFCLLISLPRCL